MGCQTDQPDTHWYLRVISLGKRCCLTAAGGNVPMGLERRHGLGRTGLVVTRLGIGVPTTRWMAGLRSTAASTT